MKNCLRIFLVLPILIFSREEAPPVEPRTSFVMHVLQPLGLPLVSSFHCTRQSIFLNTSSTDASPLEALGNFLLIPSHYIFGGKTAQIDWGKGTCEMEPSFHYEKNCLLKTVFAMSTLQISQQLGSTIKGFAYISSKTRERHKIINDFLNPKNMASNLEQYKKAGIESFYSNRLAPCLNYNRPTNLCLRHQQEIKELKELCQILDDHDIIYWLDCGTCLGAYRYGGMIPWDHDIDISILCPDHLNVKRVLQKLDPDRFQMQDWSNYQHPETFLKVYLKKTKSLIDIFHYKIDEENQTLAYFYSYQDSAIPESWKKRETCMTAPVAYDVIFPLRKANFDGLMLWVPNKIKEFLESKYGSNLEPSMVWDEKTQTYLKVENHPYWN